MKYKTLTTISLILVTFAINGCGKDASETYTYETLNNLTYVVKTKKLKHQPDIKSVFLYFVLTINNKSNKQVYLDINKIKATLNGELNSATYYNSLASVLPKKEKLKQGLTEAKLYFVYSEKLRKRELIEFKIIDYGLSEV